MIMLHDSDHELLLERLAAGDALAEDERELVRACPDCARIEGEIGKVQARLERAGARRRDVVAEARAAPPPADGPARLERLVKLPAPAFGRPTVLRLGLVAAGLAAGLAVWLWVDRDRTQPAPADPGVGFMLGSPWIKAVSPVDASDELGSYGPFRFRVEERRMGWYSIEIHDAEGPLGDPLLVSPELEAGSEPYEWNPTEAQDASMPDAIRWRVTWHPMDSAARPESSAWFSASRSPR
jgi:hypothetical protein